MLISGICENDNHPLTKDELFEDIEVEKANKTVTYDPHFIT